MRSRLCDSSVINIHDLVTATDRGEPVRNNEGRPALKHTV